jgi:hypothetical protein
MYSQHFSDFAGFTKIEVFFEIYIRIAEKCVWIVALFCQKDNILAKNSRHFWREFQTNTTQRARSREMPDLSREKFEQSENSRTFCSALLFNFAQQFFV